MSVRKTLLPLAALTIFITAYAVELYFVYTINFAACEDAYITYRFARNMAEGNGPVFNPGDPVEGYSNFLWMSALSVAHRFGLNMETVSRVAGALFNTLALFLVWYIPRRHFGLKGYSTFLAPLLYILFLPFHFYATSGLETSLYLCCILVCVHAVLWAADRPVSFAAACICLLGTALIRPEGVLLCAFLCAYLLWCTMYKNEPWKPYVPGILLFTVGYAAFLLWRLDYYGLPFPNTYYAKGSFPVFIRAALGLLMNKGFITHYVFLPLFLLALLGFARPPAGKNLHIIVLFLCAGLLFSIAFSGFDWMPFFRYTLPVVPLVIILCQILFTILWTKLTAEGKPRQKIVCAVSAGVLLLFAAEQFLYDTSFTLQWNAVNRYAMHNQRTMGLWMKRELGTQPVVAVGDVGRLAFFSNATILDIFGLTSREVALLRKRHGAPEIILPDCTISFKHYKDKELELLLAAKPDYVFFYNARLKITDSFPGSASAVADRPAFAQQYEYLDSFNVVPKFTSPYWPKLRYCIDVLDLSAGLLTWMVDGWGYDIYVRRDSRGKRFRIDCFPDGRIRSIVSR